MPTTQNTVTFVLGVIAGAWITCLVFISLRRR